MRAVAAAILEKNGHSLAHAGNGTEAVEAAEREAFDLIIMDVQMPEIDGFEATRRIRAAEQGSARHTPIVALTAHAMAGDRERCLASGMDDYLIPRISFDAIFTFAYSKLRGLFCSTTASILSLPRIIRI